MSFHIAVDIGASSGRLILGHYSDRNNIEFKEIHRFNNEFKFEDGFERWNVTSLISEILIGLQIAKKMGVEHCSVGVDTWAVDYVLVGEDGNLLAEPISYRDNRTNNAINEVTALIKAESIYQKTGIQFLNFNTIYQLFVEDRELLCKTKKILMIPDYITYVLTGLSVGEVTNVSSSQLLNLKTGDFDSDLLKIIDIPRDKFPKLVKSGTIIGTLKDSIGNIGFPKCTFIAVATHDTGSAVVGVPVISNKDNWAFLSSGTWSLIGTENDHAINNELAFKSNYSNEWGAYDTYRFLKNITGMWCVQEIARILDYKYSYEEMANLASQEEPFQQYIDLNDQRFSNPQNMIEEIQKYCMETNQVVPETVGELTMAVYSNLALMYGYELNRIESLTGKTIDILHIVGGGSNIKLLNQLTADVAQRKVITGPGEGTAIGNILVQMISLEIFESMSDARKFLYSQIDVEIYEPLREYSDINLKRFTKILTNKGVKG